MNLSERKNAVSIYCCVKEKTVTLERVDSYLFILIIIDLIIISRLIYIVIYFIIYLFIYFFLQTTK